MDFDLDELDDLIAGGASNNTRAGAKFQPKIKARPKPKTASSCVPVPSSQTSLPAVTTSHPSQSNEVSNNVSELVNSSAECSNLSENLGHIAARSLDVTLDHNTGHVNLEHESTTEKEREVYISLDSFDDLHPQSTAVEDDLNRSTHAAETNAEPENEATTLQDPLTRGEATITANERDIHLENVQFETQESEAFPCLNTQDFISAPTITSGGRTEKFQPVPKAHMHKEKNSGATANEELAVESVDWGDDYSYSYQWNTSQPENINYDDDVPAGPEFPPPLTDDLDYSATIVGLDGSMPSNLHHKENSVPESVPEMPDVGTSRYSRRERKNIQLVDEPEDEVGNDADPTFDYVDEENNAEVAVDKAPKKKRASRNSNKAGVNDKEEKKTVRKRKKGNEDESKEPKPPKKFSHSTRRNRRRQVDKTLLETPEEDIDYKKLKIRDLIIFAEYKERIEKKDSAATQTTTTNQSAANPSAKRYTEEDGYGWDPHGTDEYGDEHREEDREEEEAQHVEENSLTTYFNYQTHMEKTPVTRWSKQDTSLFYEGIKQFGTDMSMIQQLFPDKSRRQIKLKYKKEERRDPMRLHEAVLNRSSDNSQFELVIQRLNKIAAEEEKLNRDLDSSDELIVEEPAPEISPKVDDYVNVQEELPKSDKVEEEVEEIEVEKEEDSDDDMLRWSQYNSEF